MIKYHYYTYEFRTSESKILRHLNSIIGNLSASNRYHGNLIMHPDICCDSKEEAIQAIEDLTICQLEDHAVLFMDRGRKSWLVKATWRV